MNWGKRIYKNYKRVFENLGGAALQTPLLEKVQAKRSKLKQMSERKNYSGWHNKIKIKKGREYVVGTKVPTSRV